MEIIHSYLKWRKNRLLRRLNDKFILDLTILKIKPEEINFYSKEILFNNEINEILGLMSSNNQTDRELAQTKLNRMNGGRRAVMLAAISTISIKAANENK